MVQVYSDFLYKRFKAPVFSTAWIVSWIATIVLIFLPFFMAWWSHDLWKREGNYNEVPATHFKNKLILFAEGKDPSASYAWSTMDSLNDIIGFNRVRAPEVKSSTRDFDLDGITDEVNITIRLPLRSGETVHRVALLLFFEVNLKHRIRLTMEGMLHIQESSPLPGGVLHVFGDLKLLQREPLNVNRIRNEYAASLIDAATITSVKDASFPRLLSKAMARNESIELSPALVHWQSGQAGSFVVHANIRIPQQPIRYIPEAFEVLKFGWIQYLAIFVIVYFFIDWGRRFCYNYQVVPTRVTKDTIPASKLHQF